MMIHYECKFIYERIAKMGIMRPHVLLTPRFNEIRSKAVTLRLNVKKKKRNKNCQCSSVVL